MSIVFHHTPERAKVWGEKFAKARPDMPFYVWPETGPKEDVRYLAAWKTPDDLATLFPNLEVLFSLGAGIDQLNLANVPPGVKIIRMVESSLVEGMIEYVLWAVLSFHRDMFRYARQQREHVWDGSHNRPAKLYRVGLMGMGELGSPVLEKLVSFGYECRGWSRSRREVPGVKSFAGAGELDAFLAETDILVCLVPLTDATRGILNRSLFEKLPKGACLINCGRGGHLVQDDLIPALDNGQLSQAVLDVATPEPLPPEHPFWDHPRIFLTPHIASAAQSDTAAEAVLANLRRYEAGELMTGVIDTGRGY
ncbi:glyoxylate/hydroxypyruvate reductase A [Gluconobacter sp. LMG 31484]|uniref:Glyoxylate/hydroxypyruvate reductase A n=1 Tax=Gluconobacter vitians TaxID=2728102 RepID=A0ABR9Y608_9PROT|nr:glyoxylate/hydroxypyruvate reductase A [Gluconobacter vitians]MBF0859280.1 glyoxylate/hydroxypyruvate reductase A [Gluconobacter vitians]